MIEATSLVDTCLVGARVVELLQVTSLVYVALEQVLLLQVMSLLVALEQVLLVEVILKAVKEVEEVFLSSISSTQRTTP